MQAIEWPAYFRQLFSHEDVQIALREDEPIVNRSPQYLTRLLQLLKETPNRSVTVWSCSADCRSFRVFFFSSC